MHRFAVAFLCAACSGGSTGGSAGPPPVDARPPPDQAVAGSKVLFIGNSLQEAAAEALAAESAP